MTEDRSGPVWSSGVIMNMQYTEKWEERRKARGKGRGKHGERQTGKQADEWGARGKSCF